MGPTPAETTKPVTPTEEALVVAIGPGGNIGSSLWPHLARMPGVGAVRLIDRDQYESSNFSSQNIMPGDVGRAKARAVAARMSAINPALAVEAIVARVEDVPLGMLRADVVLTCLDSRGARSYVNEVVRRLGVAWWVDAGVERNDLLARVNVYRPDSPCYECSWGDAEYELPDQAYPCGGPAPTDAPSALGALAASLQALELHKILAGEWAETAAGKQITISAAHHTHYVTSLHLNPGCRCPHDAWTIEPLDATPDQITIGEALGLDEARAGSTCGGGLRVSGKSFIRRMRCRPCGRWRSELCLDGRLSPQQRTCDRCGEALVVGGFDRIERLGPDVLGPADFARSLRSVGFQPGDVFTIERGGHEGHYEIGGAS